jgi:ribosome recycling factor
VNVQHVSAVSRAIQASPYSLTPQPAPPSSSSAPELELHIPFPRATQESLTQVLREAAKAGERAQQAIGQARQAHQKRLRHMALHGIGGSASSSKKGSVLRPDDLAKATKLMEKEVEAGHAELKKTLERAKKILQGPAASE